jgi:hypothetical protein
MLGLAAASLIAVPNRWHHLAQKLGTERLTISQIGTEVVLAVGIHQFRIAAEQFSGNPRLVVEEDEHQIQVSLSGAYFPGSDFPADFQLEITRRGAAAEGYLAFAFGATFRFDIVAWIADGIPVRTVVTLKQPITCGSDLRIATSSAVECSFAPDWTLQFYGKERGITAESEDFTVHGTRLVLSLGRPDQKSAILNAPRRVSRWTLSPAIGTVTSLRQRATWRIQGEDIPFTSLDVEARSSARGNSIVVATLSGDTATPLTLIPNPAHEDITLALHSPTLAFLASQSQREHFVRAYYDDTPRWIHTDIGSLEVGGGADAAPFELHTVDDSVAHVQCEPVLHRTRLAVAGALVEPSAPPEPTTIAVSVPQNEGAQGSKKQLSVKPAPSKVKASLTISDSVIAQLKSNFSLTVLRPADLLHVRFDFVNITLSGTTLTVGANALLVVTFPPQSIAERAFYESAPGESGAGTNEPPTMPPVPARIAGESRLVFRVPQSVGTLPLTLDALLDWSKFTLNVAPTAIPPSLGSTIDTAAFSMAVVQISSFDTRKQVSQVSNESKVFQLSPALTGLLTTQQQAAITKEPSLIKFASGPFVNILSQIITQKIPPSEPKPEHTAIELPYRLYVSPHELSGWAHRRQLPANSSEPIELWHTRLGVRLPDGTVDEYFAPLRTIRAIWSKDYRTPPPDANDLWPFRTSLTRNDRYQIVQLSANFALPNYTPQPISVERLMLTALGGWLRSRGVWEPPQGLSVEEWTHRATLGRDHYVRVVYKGYLFPFGHRASLVKVTERKFHRTPRGQTAAYLFQRMFIVVREPIKRYPANGLPGQLFGGRNIPFRAVEVRPLVTPNLDDPTTTGIAGKGINAFWPKVGGKHFSFTLVATDWEGRTSEFTMPLVFIQQTANDASNLNNIVAAYNGQTAERTIELNGQQITYAPPNKTGDTTLETQSMLFTASVPAANTSGLNSAKHPWFYPVMERAQVRIKEIAGLLGTNATTDVKFFSDGSSGYLDVGFGGNNKGEVYLELITPIDMNFSNSTDKAGGLASPNIKVAALSRIAGPVGANSPFDDFVNGKFDPAKFFCQTFEAELIGSVKLRDILQWIVFAAVGAQEIPKLVQQTVYKFVKDVSQLANDVEQTYKQTIQNIEQLPGAVSAVLQTATTQLKAAVDDLKTSAQNLWSNYSSFINSELGGVTTIPELREKIKDRIDTTSKQLRAALDQLEERKKQVEEKINAVKSIVEAEIKAIKDLEKETREKYNQWKQQFEQWMRGLELSYDWKTRKLKSWPGGNPIFEVTSGNSDPEKNTLLALNTTVSKQWDANPPTVIVEGKLTNFKLHLIAGIMEFLQIDVDRITVSSKNFEKVKVDPKIGAIAFKGPLSFVSKLQEMIPKGLGDFLPKIDVHNNPGIIASWKIALPNVAVGVLSIQNLALFIVMKVPFAAEPLTLRFSFCQRSSPFTLTVSIFGGGGFFALEVTPAGVQLLEASFEFGAQAALDLGIASGSVGVVAGIYYKLVKQGGGDVASLEGYLRIWGCVKVLGGIASASIVLYMSLTWQSNGKVYGQASLTIEVRIVFFSFSASVKVERQFKGSSGDPTFAQLVPSQAVWEEYCLAFA